MKWWRLAAAQGVAGAQFFLASMYAQGEGVPQDFVLAHMWTNFAATQGDEGAIEARKILGVLMTKTQIAEAQRLAREWMPKGK